MKRRARRRSGWERSPGWVVQGLGTAALVGGWFVALMLPGWVWAHVSNVVGYVAARFQ